MGRLLLVRHGESIWNSRSIVQGQAGPGLSELGHAQAVAVGAWLARTVPDAALVSSDLERCRETAAPYAEAVGREPVLDARLRERHFGSWQGLSRDELVARDPALWTRFLAREDVLEEAGGESTPALVGRVVPALRALAAANPVTVVVTHGGPVWHGTHAMLRIPEPTLGFVANAGVTVLDVPEPGPDDPAPRPVLICWNQTAHLD